MLEWRRHLYSALFYLAAPFLLCRLWWRGRKSTGYRQAWLERFGFIRVSPLKERPIWVHAVSVGETIAIAPFVERFLQEHPDVPVVMTSMTPTGAERAQALFGQRIQHAFCPYDLPIAMNHFLKRVRPRGLLIVETELWPNMIAACHQSGVPVMVANARLSERSARGYARFSGLAKPMLSRISLLAAQHKDDAERFISLGLSPERCTVTGSIKFDMTVSPDVIKRGAELHQQLGSRPTVILASSHQSEERLFLEVMAQLKTQYPTLLGIIVPRHPERFDPVFHECKTFFDKVVRSSSGDQPSAQCDIYLGDVMGQLMSFYAAADIAVMGGSFANVGGHNPVEPASLGLPVIMGPHHFNFQAISEQMNNAGGMVIIDDGHALKEALITLLLSDTKRTEVGEKAAAFAASQRGALDQLYHMVEQRLI